VGTYDELSVGDVFTTPRRRIDASEASELIRIGGYTHQLFTDPAFAASSTFGRSPLPGQAVLLLMGGLVEQSGRFDDTVIALLGFEDVRFMAPAFPGDELHVEVEVVAKEPRSDRGVLTMSWTCRTDRDTVVQATARMLFRTASG
jgi:acyl dehydratase